MTTEPDKPESIDPSIPEKDIVPEDKDSSTHPDQVDQQEETKLSDDTHKTNMHYDKRAKSTRFYFPDPREDFAYGAIITVRNELKEYYTSNRSPIMHYLLNHSQDIDRGIDLLEKWVLHSISVSSKLEKEKKDCDSYYRQLKSANDELIREKNEVRRLKDQLASEKQKKESASKKQIEDLRWEVEEEIKRQKREELERIKSERDKLQSKFDDLESSRSALLAELAAYRRDKTSTHIAGDRPQNYALAQEYKSLKEQYLDELAGSLIDWLAVNSPEQWAVAGEHKRNLCRVKAMLSRTILLKGQAIINHEDGGLPEPNPELVNEIQGILQSKINLADNSPDLENFKNGVINLLSLGLGFVEGKAKYPQAGSWQNEDFERAVNEIKAVIAKSFAINLADLGNELITELDEAIKESLKFVEKMALADPPGKFCPEQENAKYNPDTHEIAKGCLEESGQVIETVYPFYIDSSYTQKNTVRVAALVWLEPSPTHPSSESDSPDPKPPNSEVDSAQTKPVDDEKTDTPESSSPQGDKDGSRIVELRAKLLNRFHKKQFSEPVSVFAVGESVFSSESEIMKDIEAKIALLTDEKIIEEVDDFLMNARSLNDFHAEINRVTTSSPNN